VPAQRFRTGTVPAGLMSAAEQAALKLWLASQYSNADQDATLIVQTGVDDTDWEGDLSTYSLTLLPTPALAAGFDVPFSSIDFAFKVECPKDFDCLDEPTCAEEVPTAPLLDYTAKDYGSFRRLMLDRLATVLPSWTERNPADVGMTVVEALAYAADHLSYYQDAVATEAYLNTARRRTSVRRHARLLDYRMHEGCNARAWVQIGLDPLDAAVDGRVLPAGTGLCTRVAGQPGVLDQASVPLDAVRFETMQPIALRRSHSEILIHTWGNPRWWLEQGATSCSLRPEDETMPLALAAGDVLIFEEVLSPATGLAADRDPARRVPVRLSSVSAAKTDVLLGVTYFDVTWFADDALPFPLCVAAVLDDGVSVVDATVARGNVVLADHGARGSEKLPPVPLDGLYRPTLQALGLTVAQAYDDALARGAAAAGALAQSARDALPVIALQRGSVNWELRFDLLGSRGDDEHFVVEMENDGSATLRFGDGQHGREPDPSASSTDVFVAKYRVGSGSAGNVSAESLAHVINDGSVPLDGITSARNPQPAQGGRPGERLDEVRLYAPQAFRVQERAVTPDDYARMAERNPEVKKAAATLRWTGSWHTVFITVERRGEAPVDDGFKADLRRFLERYRLAGEDVEIESPAWVPLEIVMGVCVAPGYFQADVQRALEDVFTSGQRADGEQGFFNPDRFTFGQSVWLSQVVAAAMAVQGVAFVDLGPSDPRHRFRRFGQPAQGELDAGRIAMSRIEIARLDNSANFPENGRIDFILEGGL
jgi:hypothetical protein